MENNIYTRVLKEHLPQFINRNVTVIGKFKSKMGNKLTIETAENSFYFYFFKTKKSKFLAVILVENCDYKFDENTSFLEIRGNVKNSNTLIMNEFNELPEDEKEPFGINKKK